MMGYIVLAMTALGADAATIPLATFGSGDATFRTFNEKNDPVMGGRSTGNYTAQDGVGVWRGVVAIVPSLQAPGFITIQSETAEYKDISSCSGIAITARTHAPYGGYRFSFGTKHNYACSFFSSGFKAPFAVPPASDYTTVTIPFTEFTDCNSDSTGEPTKKCDGHGGEYCPDKATLENIQTMTLWAEGVAGTVAMDIQKVEAVGCAAEEALLKTTRPPKEFDVCEAKVQDDLRYNMSQFDKPIVPGNVSATESLATAVCCDSRTKVFAEPQFLYEAVQLFSQMNGTGLTTFYDTVCGIPLFTVPLGRTFADFKADTTEHGWPSFRKEELHSGNVRHDDQGFVYSKCGTHLGSYLPDAHGPRWCLDLSCVSGNLQ